MHNVIALITASTIALSTIATPSPKVTSAAADKPVTARAAVEIAAVEPLTIVGADEREAELIHDIVGRFVDAGLELPPLAIGFSSDEAECGGHAALHHGGVGNITVCRPLPLTIAHEMAHAWAAANLTEADRERYTEVWDLPTWGSHDHEWKQRATERAANTIAFAMILDLDEPSDNALRHLCTYEALTGLPVPGVTLDCGEPHPVVSRLVT